MEETKVIEGKVHNGNTAEAPGQSAVAKQGRMANLELLRMVSMMLVVVLHFLGKGGGLTPLTESTMPGYGYLAWVLEAFAIVAVNVYMLLSGFFLVESSFKVKRLIQLLLQVWFYSIGIGMISAAFGILPEGGFGIHYLLMLFFPVSMNHYWFMTAYVFMYLFTPMLAAGIKKLTKRQLQLVIVVLLITFSIVKSLVPGRLEADMQGYDCIWYLCVFVVAAYIRLYGISFLRIKARSLFVYLAAVAGIAGATFFLRYLYLQTGRMETMLTVCYNYNHILVLIASVAFFYLFYQSKLAPSAFSRAVCKLAPYTLGVYLWHEHVAVRYEWQQWLYRLTGVPEGAASLFFTMLLAVALVFVIGVVLDMVRSLLFGGFHKLLLHMGCYRRFMGWLDTMGGF